MVMSGRCLHFMCWTGSSFLALLHARTKSQASSYVTILYHSVNSVDELCTQNFYNIQGIMYMYSPYLLCNHPKLLICHLVMLILNSWKYKTVHVTFLYFILFFIRVSPNFLGIKQCYGDLNFAQGHNTAPVGFKPSTSRLRVCQAPYH